jgi:uroporphyrin-III C-methyltransferase
MNERPDDPDERPRAKPEPQEDDAPVIPTHEQGPDPEDAAGTRGAAWVPAGEEAPPEDDTAGGPVEASAAPPAPAPRRGIATGVALLALVLALGSLALAGYLWWASGDTAAGNEAAIRELSGTLRQAQASLQELGQRVGRLDTAAEGHADQLADLERQLTGELEGMRDRFDSVPGRLSSLESSMASLQGISAGARDAWLLAEAEYYLEIANAQLQLARNPERALLALRFADQRIRQLSDPALTGVRRALAEELRAVEALEQPDIEGISLTLASLADAVEALPLQEDPAIPGSDPEPPAADASGWDRAMASVKAAFSDIVTVRRTDEPVTPLLAPDAAYFLRANLALRLQTARLALLRGEQQVFEQSLVDAAAWLREYYDAESRAVQSALETLSGLRAADFTVRLPEISESLRLLREFRQRTAGAPERPANEPAQ